MTRVFPARPHKPQGGFVENLSPPAKRALMTPPGGPKQFTGSQLLVDVLRTRGLGENLNLLLDAADPRSFKAGDTEWTSIEELVRPDKTSQTTGFFLGTDATAQSIDPVWSGAGYFTFDGTQYMTINPNSASSQPTWIKNLHKANAVQTILYGYYTSQDKSTTLVTGLQTQTNSSSIGGVYSPFAVETDNGSGADGHEVSQGTPAAFLTANHRGRGWNIAGANWTEVSTATSYFFMNGGMTAKADWSSVSTPSAADPTYSCKIGATGSASATLAAGCRIAWIASWGVQLTDQQIQAVYQEMRGRFGI